MSWSSFWWRSKSANTHAECQGRRIYLISVWHKRARDRSGDVSRLWRQSEFCWSTRACEMDQYTHHASRITSSAVCIDLVCDTTARRYVLRALWLTPADTHWPECTSLTVWLLASSLSCWLPSSRGSSETGDNSGPCLTRWQLSCIDSWEQKAHCSAVI